MIEVNELVKRFGRRDALRGVSFSMGTGCTALLGPNGAGKTTLIRCLAGLVKPTSGGIVIDSDARPHASLPAGTFGYLPQHFDFFKELTAAETLRYLATLGGIERRLVPSEVERCLEAVNLRDRGGARIRSLSGGMLRRLGIAQTLLGSPHVLLYDEPTTGLDPEERARFKSLLLSLKTSSQILLSTHIVDDIQLVCDTVVVMDAGRVLFSGTPDALKERARGRVRITPQLTAQNGPDVVFAGTVIRNGAPQHRVVTRTRSGSAALEPSLDEGYLCVTHGFEDEA